MLTVLKLYFIAKITYIYNTNKSFPVVHTNPHNAQKHPLLRNCPAANYAGI